MRKSKWNALSWVFLVLLAACEGFFAAVIVKLDMLPAKYGFLLLGIVVLLDLLAAILAFPKTGKWQKDQRIGRRVVAYVLAFLISAGCIAGTLAVNKLQAVLDRVTGGTASSAVVEIYVLQEDSALALSDMAGDAFGYTDAFDKDNIRQAMEHVSDNLNGNVSFSRYETLVDLVGALYNGEVRAILLNQAYTSILSDTEGYAAFSTRVRTLSQVTTVKTEPTNGDNTPAKPTSPWGGLTGNDITKKPFLLYLSGSDTRSAVLDSSRSDVNIIAAVNPVTKQILLLNTPRDYYVANPEYGGSMDKLTHLGIYGTDVSMRGLSDLYNEQIDYYAQINFSGFETLIDAIGGVTVDSDYEFWALNEFYIQQGENDLNGEEALAFARERYALPGGDNDRGKNQMKVITGVVKKLTSGTTILSNYTQIMDSLEGMFATNFNMNDLSKLVKMQLDDMASWHIVSYAVTGYGDSRETCSAPGEYLYVTIPDQDSVDRAIELIDMVMDGKTLPDEP